MTNIRTKEQSKEKNIVLLTVECLRPDHVHSLGYSKKITPTLDDLASEGVVFTRAYATAPWTPASFLGIHTSTLPFMNHGIVSPTSENRTLAQVLKGKRYETGAFVPRHWLSSFFNWNRGFKLYDSGKKMKKVRNTPQQLRKAVDKIPGGMEIADLLGRYINYKHSDPWSISKTQKALSFIRKNHHKKFFLWIHYQDTHEPYYPPARSLSSFPFSQLWWINYKAMKPSSHPRGDFTKVMDNPTKEPALTKNEIQTLLALYDMEIKVVDWAISLLRQELKNLGLYSNTYFIISADHGQQFFEHGFHGHGTLYEECLHVPLIVAGPNLPHQRISTPVSLLDLAPTILDLLNYEETGFFMGSSYFNEKKQKVGSEDPRVFAEHAGRFSINGGDIRYDLNQKAIALITEKWKYIYKEFGEDEFYNLRKDPREENNLHKEKELRGNFREQVRQHLKFGRKRFRTIRSIQKVKSKISPSKKNGKED